MENRSDRLLRRNLAAYLLFFANRSGVCSFSAQILNCERVCQFRTISNFYYDFTFRGHHYGEVCLPLKFY